MTSHSLHRCWVFAALLSGSVLTGCAGKAPKELGAPIADMPTPGAAQAAPERFVGDEVRWGGEILGVRNAADHTDVEVYGRPLEDDAEPKPDGGEGVRFVARVAGFLDPVEYAVGKRLTVRGRVQVPITHPVGEFPYRYPLVAVDASHLWPAYEAPEPVYHRYPYWDPWWPWRPYRYPYRW